MTSLADRLGTRPARAMPRTGRALITGAGSGLGLAMAERFAADGWRVLLTDIDPARLAAATGRLAAAGAGERVRSLPLDVRDDAAWQAALAWCEREWGGLDLLVNNAGVAAGGRMELVPMADWDWILDLNLKSVIRGCRTVIPLFKRQGWGYLVNVASLAGLANAPGMASYNTTKAAVVSLSQTLRYELAPYGIGVSAVCPAFVATNLVESMRSPDPGAVRQARHMLETATVTAAQVADTVAEAVAAQRFLVLTHREGYAVRALQRLAPGVLERVVVARWRQLRSRLEGTGSADRDAVAGPEGSA